MALTHSYHVLRIRQQHKCTINMATNRRQRKEDSKSTIPLSRPNTTVSDSTRETLLDIAAKRGILKSQAEEGESQDEEIVTGRAADAMLWSMSLAMLHFTLDVLVHHQYAMTIEYNVLGSRFLQAFASSSALFHHVQQCANRAETWKYNK